jgi:hypothetical protein
VLLVSREVSGFQYKLLPDDLKNLGAVTGKSITIKIVSPTGELRSTDFLVFDSETGRAIDESIDRMYGAWTDEGARSQARDAAYQAAGLDDPRGKKSP